MTTLKSTLARVEGLETEPSRMDHAAPQRTKRSADVMLLAVSISCPPDRSAVSWNERWMGADDGLITSWLAGIKLSASRPDIATKAKANELPVLPWKGGVEKALKSGAKWGHLRYVAMWQGLRGDDLSIQMDQEFGITCTRTNVTTTFTRDMAKLSFAEESGNE